MNPDKKKSARTNVKWIAGAMNPAHRGMLHKALNVAKGDKIPAAKLAASAKGDSATAKRARMAVTLRKLNG